MESNSGEFERRLRALALPALMARGEEDVRMGRITPMDEAFAHRREKWNKPGRERDERALT